MLQTRVLLCSKGNASSIPLATGGRCWRQLRFLALQGCGKQTVPLCLTFAESRTWRRRPRALNTVHPIDAGPKSAYGKLAAPRSRILCKRKSAPIPIRCCTNCGQRRQKIDPARTETRSWGQKRVCGAHLKVRPFKRRGFQPRVMYRARLSSISEGKRAMPQPGKHGSYQKGTSNVWPVTKRSRQFSGTRISRRP
jgi:hypothetical protein